MNGQCAGNAAAKHKTSIDSAFYSIRILVSIAISLAIFVFGISVSSVEALADDTTAYTETLKPYRVSMMMSGRPAVILSDHSLWVWDDPWGYDGHDIVMDSKGLTSGVPKKIMDNVEKIVSGYYHVAVLKTDGTVWVWGHNNACQFGDGTNVGIREVSEARQVLDGVTDVFAGLDCTAAIKTDGSLWAWGNGASLLNSECENWSVPVKVLDDAIQVEFGGSLRMLPGPGYSELHSGCWVGVLRQDGTLWMAGQGKNAVLGDGAWGEHYVESLQQVPIDHVVQFSTSDCHTTAVCSDGSLYGWGSSSTLGLSEGEEGLYSYEKYQTHPIKIQDDIKYSECFHGSTSSIDVNGYLYVWGSDSGAYYNQSIHASPSSYFGNDSKDSFSIPTPVLEDFSDFSIADSSARFIYCLNNGSIWISNMDGLGSFSYEPACVFANGEWLYTEEHPDGPPAEPFELKDAASINASFKFRSDLSPTNTLENTISYDDEWLFSSSESDRYSLLKASIRVALAAYGTQGDGSKANITALMDTLGFDYTEGSVIYPKPTQDTIGYAIGMKNVRLSDGTARSIILVAVRGGGYGQEWGNNFKVGYGDAHNGFEDAAGQVYRGLASFLKRHETKVIGNKPMVWVCGYSRGAATANLLAAQLIDRTGDADLKFSIGEDDIRAFCFECPQNVSIDKGEASSSRYRNIINVVNPIDIVPKVAPAGPWGFRRYGVTYYTPARETTRGYQSQKSNMVSAYEGLFARNGLEYSPHLHAEALTQAFSLDTLFSSLTALVTRDVYRNYIQQWACDTAAEKLGKDMGYGHSKAAMIGEFTDGLVRKFPVLKPVDWYLSNLDNPYANLLNAHQPELCMSWIDSLGGFDGLSTKCQYRVFFVNCPVDVAVYDADGNVVGRISGDAADGESQVAALVDENGQKVVVLPMDADFRVELAATGDGTVTCTATEFDADAGVTERVVSYQDVAVQEGDVLTAQVGTATPEGEPTLAVSDAEGQPLEPTLDESGDEVRSHAVAASAAEGGSVTGGGAFVDGTYCGLEAIPDEGWEFAGWYEGGKLVCGEASWRFPADGDRDLEARFVRPLSAATVSAIEDQTWTVAPTEPAPVVMLDDVRLAAGTDYAVTYRNNTTVGTATAVIEGRGGYTGVVEVNFQIVQAKAVITAYNKELVIRKTGKVGALVTQGAGALSYRSSKPKVVSVDKNGKLKGLKAGTAKITVTSAGNTNIAAGKKVIAVKVGKKNPVTAKRKAASVKVAAKTVSKKAVTLASNVSVSKAQGKVSYANASSNATAGKFKVSAKTGKVTVPKGTKKGTYVIKIKVTAKGNKAYISGSKTVSFKVVVK